MVLDDLEANALYLTNGDVKILLVNCNLIGLAGDFMIEAQTHIAERANVPAENIIVCCTHTHGGPMVYFARQDMPLNEAYLEHLLGRWSSRDVR